MTSEIAHLIGGLAIAKQIIRQGEICLSFIPCPRQLGDQVIQEDIDWFALKDQVILPKPTAAFGSTARGWRLISSDPSGILVVQFFYIKYINTLFARWKFS